MNIVDDVGRALRGIANCPGVSKPAVVEADAQVSDGIQFTAAKVGLSGSDGIGNLEQELAMGIWTHGKNGAGVPLIDEDLVIAGRLQGRAALPQGISAAQRPQRVYDVVDKFPAHSVCR